MCDHSDTCSSALAGQKLLCAHLKHPAHVHLPNSPSSPPVRLRFVISLTRSDRDRATRARREDKRSIVRVGLNHPSPSCPLHNLSPSRLKTRIMDFSHFPPTAELIEDLELLKHPEGGTYFYLPSVGTSDRGATRVLRRDRQAGTDGAESLRKCVCGDAGACMQCLTPSQCAQMANCVRSRPRYTTSSRTIARMATYT